MANRAEEILDSAYQLIVEKGYHGFSYADIADEIGIRKASIHYHFPTKDALVLAVVQRYRRGIHAQISQVKAGKLPPRDQLQAYLDFWEHSLGLNTNDVCLCMHLGSEVPTLPETVQKEVRDHFEELTEWITTLLESSDTSEDEDMRQEANAMVATIHGAMLSARTFHDVAYFTSISQQVLAHLAA